MADPLGGQLVPGQRGKSAGPQSFANGMTMPLWLGTKSPAGMRGIMLPTGLILKGWVRRSPGCFQLPLMLVAVINEVSLHARHPLPGTRRA